MTALLAAAGMTAQSDGEPGVSGGLTYASRHVFRGIERAGSSVQASAEYRRDGWRGGLWLNQPFSGETGRELDAVLSFWHTTSGGIRWEASATYFGFPGVEAGGTRWSMEAGLEATWSPVGSITPGVSYSHDFRLRSDQVQLELTRSVALTKIGAFLELALFAGQATGADWRPDAPGPRRRDSYRYWGGEIHLPYRIGAHSTVIAGLHYARASGRSETEGPVGRAGRDKFWVTLGVNVDF